MNARLSFDNLLSKRCDVLEQIPAHRTGTNTQDSLKDAGVGAFSVFHTPEENEAAPRVE